MNWNCEKASIAHTLDCDDCPYNRLVIYEIKKTFICKMSKKDLAANIQTCPLRVHKPATIKAGRNFGFYEQDLVHFMYCVPRLGWALRPLQSASHARIPSMKSGCFSSNLSNACPQALLLHSLEAHAPGRRGVRLKARALAGASSS